MRAVRESIMHGSMTDLARTYCNPIALPDYPKGMCVDSKDRPEAFGFVGLRRRDWRETADPTVLFHDGTWYLYSSCGLAYVSEDFCTWRHVRIEPVNPGYAPTVVRHRGAFLLTALGAPMYRADNPLGPFTEVGPVLMPDGSPHPYWMDPCLFADDDGALYAYWGLGGDGIFGARLDPEAPNRLIADPVRLFGFDPAHEWERPGEYNEVQTHSFVEGAWALKVGERYFLTYAAPGTEWTTYGMGTYVSDRPLGPFVYQQRNPILRDTSGLVNGPGHGSIVPGPNGTLWAFYTCCVRICHLFERRIGLDPAGIDAQGNLFVNGASEIPQWGPGVRRDPESGNGAGLLPLTVNKVTRPSSEREGFPARFATDDSLRTWWEPEAGDAQPTLEVDLMQTFQVAAVRLCWNEPDLDYAAGVLPGPVRWRLEGRGEAKDAPWTVLADAADNATDWLIDYRTFPAAPVRHVRLTILGTAPRMRPAVSEFTVFGCCPGAGAAAGS